MTGVVKATTRGTPSLRSHTYFALPIARECDYLFIEEGVILWKVCILIQ